MKLHPHHILKDLDGTAFLEEFAFSVIPGTGPYIIPEGNIKNQESFTFERYLEFIGQKIVHSISISLILIK